MPGTTPGVEVAGLRADWLLTPG